jgi:transposase
MGQDQEPKRWTAGRARELLAEAKQSGESLSAFAERRGIDPQRLYSWRRKLGAAKGAESPTTSEAFVPVRIAPDPRATPPSGFEVVLSEGRVVRVGADFDARALRRLVEALEEASR